MTTDDILHRCDGGACPSHEGDESRPLSGDRTVTYPCGGIKVALTGRVFFSIWPARPQMEDLVRLLEVADELTGSGLSLFSLADMSRLRWMSKETRGLLIQMRVDKEKAQRPEFAARALVVRNRLVAGLIAAHFWRVPSRCPVRTFDNLEDAYAWLDTLG